MIYRFVMKLAHHFDWHYAPVLGPIAGGPRPFQRWCKWCGLRQSYKYDPRKPLPGPIKRSAFGEADQQLTNKV